MKKIPKALYKEYEREQRELIKYRIQFFGWVFVLAFVGITFISHLFIIQHYSYTLATVWGICMVGSLGFTFLIRKQSNLGLTKLTAFTWILFLLVLIAYYHYSVHLPAAQAVLLYVFMLFGISLTIPWRPFEIIGIWAIHTLGYSISFLWLQPDLFPFFSLKRNFVSQCNDIFFIILRSPQLSEFLYGMIVLFCTSFICYIARKSEYERSIEHFLLMEEIASKNIQIQKDIELATRVHKRLIPASKDTPRAAVDVRYLPAHYISGDYARFHFYDERELLFIMVDITGHGIPAALLVNTLHTEFERLRQEVKDPGILLKYLEQFVRKDFSETGLYLTAFCGRIIFPMMKLSYSNYGHPSQYLFHQHSSQITPLSSLTTILGSPLDDTTIYQQEIDVKEGDHIFLFTDGLVETKNTLQEEYGQKNLERFIARRHASPIDQFNTELLKEVTAFNNDTFADDVFLMHILIK